MNSTQDQGRAPFEVITLAGHQGLVHGEDAEVLVRIDIQLPAALRRVARHGGAGAHLGLLLDVSGSMMRVLGKNFIRTGRFGPDGDGQQVEYVEGGTSKLDALIAAASRVVEQAQQIDRLTVLHFSSVVSTPVTADGSEKAILRAAIAQSRALPHEQTDLAAGLAALLGVLGARDTRPRTALLFTDGRPDEAEKPRVLADRFAEAGVPLSVLGFGDDLELSYVEDLASRGRGQVIGTRDAAALEAALLEVLGQSQRIAVTNLGAQLRFAPFVTPQDLHRARPQSQLLRAFEPSVREYRVALGSLGAETWQTLFVRLHVCGDRLPPVGYKGRLFELTVTGDAPSQQIQNGTVTVTVDVPIVDRAAPRNHAEVDDAFRMALLLDLSRQFEASCRERRFDVAKDLAVRLRRGYQQIATPEAAANDAALGVMLKKFDSQGEISLDELNRRLNDVVSSRTKSGVSKALTPSQTRPGAPSATSRTRPFGGG